MPQPKAATLDLLRAVAALSVVVLHISPLVTKLGYRIPGAPLGEVGVQLFFVLSGYLITNAVLSRSYSPRTYAVNRSLRILPAYFFALLVALSLRDAQPLSTVGGLKDITAHVFLVHGWFKNYRVSLNPVLWTLSIEWLFYLFMLACARGMRHRTVRWYIVAAMFFVPLMYRVWIWGTYAHAAQLSYMYKQLPGMMDEFACGTAAALAMKHASVRQFVARSGSKITGLTLSLAGLAVTLWLFSRHGSNNPVGGYWNTWYMIILWPLAFCGAATGLLVSLLQFEVRLAPWIRRSGLGLVGTCSYSLYLFHTVVIQVFSAGWHPHRTSVPPSVYLAFAVIGVFAVAAMSYFMVELPFMRLRTRFVTPRSATPSGPVLLDPRESIDQAVGFAPSADETEASRL